MLKTKDGSRNTMDMLRNMTCVFEEATDVDGAEQKAILFFGVNESFVKQSSTETVLNRVIESSSVDSNNNTLIKI